jgi:hypothetical protein
MTDAGAGPFVAIATLCHSVERRSDGAMDVLGVVEAVEVEPPPPDDTDPLGLRPLAVISLRLLVSLRAGSMHGTVDVRIVGRYPAGNTGASTSVFVEFSELRPVATINVPLELEIHEAGTYHFDVRADGRLLTVVPLRVELASDPTA